MIDSPTTGRNLMFEHSRVVETGSFDELLQAGGPRRTRQVAVSFRLNRPRRPARQSSRGGVSDMSNVIACAEPLTRLRCNLRFGSLKSTGLLVQRRITRRRVDRKPREQDYGPSRNLKNLLGRR
jgi:hypothetical protein